jgi:hypothetical protein
VNSHIKYIKEMLGSPKPIITGTLDSNFLRIQQLHTFLHCKHRLKSAQNQICTFHMMTAVVVMFGGRVDTPLYLFVSPSLPLFALLHKKFKLLDFQS